MNILWHTPVVFAGGERLAPPVWPPDWPVPSVGDQIVTHDANLRVAEVIWCPYGGAGDPTNTDPYVYVVLKDPR